MVPSFLAVAQRLFTIFLPMLVFPPWAITCQPLVLHGFATFSTGPVHVLDQLDLARQKMRCNSQKEKQQQQKLFIQHRMISWIFLNFLHFLQFILDVISCRRSEDHHQPALLLWRQATANLRDSLAFLGFVGFLSGNQLKQVSYMAIGCGS